MVVSAGQNTPEHQPAGEPETNSEDGQSAENDEQNLDTEDGESGDEATGGEPSGAELPEGVTPEMLVKAGYIADKDYKELQREYGSRTDADKALQERFNTFGGVEASQEMLAYLQNNPKFAEFLKHEQDSRMYGQPADEIDPQTKEAMDIVKRISNEEIDKAMREQVDPIASSYKEGLLSQNMGKMSDKYPDWMEMKDTMANLAESMPDSMQDNPSFNDLESLYVRALVETGKIADFGKNIYEGELKSAKAKSVDKPSVAKKGISGNAKSMQEAYKMALEQESK